MVAGVSGSGVHIFFKHAEGFFSVDPSGISWAVSRVSNIDESGLMMRCVFRASGAPTVSVSLVVVSGIVVSGAVG